jgi:bifunctional UDP-N-acetylglucosamine pyrophosphorylase/glucosamine-1-phosphate N-acetyltransferase
MNKVSIVVLAAGEGTRMKSGRSKVLHPLAGKPLVRWVLSAISALKPDAIYLIVGHKADQVREELAGEKVVFVEQKQQLGSGHALMQTEKHLKKYSGDIIVLCADTPLIKADTLRNLLKTHRKQKNAATILSAEFDNPLSYGRIVRMPSGKVQGIVEEKDATLEQKKIKEINSGIYCFQSPQIWKALSRITPNNQKKEYYLTDAISILNNDGFNVDASMNVQPYEIMGVNNRLDLSKAEKIVRKEVIEQAMLNGVTIIDPEHTYITPGVKIGQDTVIYPGSIIEGKTTIGSNCIIGPNTVIKNAEISNDSSVIISYVTDAKVGEKVKIGPYAHLRPGTILKKGAKVGNFSEIKNAVIEEGSKVNHLSYIGDAELGVNVNVGAGTITCNYDGVKKSKTIIGDRVFVGSNVNLVAPVKVGHDVLLGAGSTITDDVPAKNLAIARARQVNKIRKK